jgi:predicted dehydrogenase
MQKIRWGILGGGKIAHKFAGDLKLVDDAELTAIASRDIENARAFQEKHLVKMIFTDYESLASSPEVDVIYIATPHGLHHEHVMLCLKHRKAVLCEKAFALNLSQLKEMVSFARKQKVFLMEAFWTRFIPQFVKVKHLVESGEIGEIKLIQADFGFKAAENPAQRLYDPALGGGSLLDIGIYPIFLAQTFLGKPTDIKALITPHPTKVDEQCAMIMKFGNGALAVLSSTFLTDTPVEAVIAGTKGRIQMRNRFHNAVSHLEVVSTGENETRTIEVDRESGYGYQFEARHVSDCLRKNLTESPLLSLQHSLDLMETLDRVRAACGIVYPVD